TGEYVSVQSQADTEQAALEREGGELRDDPKGELRELTHIYVERGLAPALAAQVAKALMAHDAIGAHARDELGITESMRARPLQAALASALSFAVGAALPLLVVLLAPMVLLAPAIVVSSLLFLALLGGLAARTGGARVGRGVLRVVFWSALSMAAASGIGALFGITAA
ncbi:MAG: VIT1/CCC1 transporter family protein, partial [Janthinobacterium sp.]